METNNHFNDMSDLNDSSETVYTLMPGEDGTEYVISNKGIPYVTIKGAASMCGVDEKFIRDAMDGRVPSLRDVQLNPAIKAIVVTPLGLRSARLLDSLTVFHLVCRYNPKLGLTMSRARSRD